MSIADNQYNTLPSIRDCFVNHYEQFTWDQLNEKGVQEHYRALGWTQDHWEQTSFAGDLPFTEGRWWDMLTTNEKKAANKLCYFEDNWVSWLCLCYVIMHRHYEASNTIYCLHIPG